jgi:hypothetical protein
MIEWFTDNAWWLMAAGFVMSVAGVGVLLALAILMPADHFMPRRLRADAPRPHPALRVLGIAMKNLFGAALLVLGLILALPLVPGPGVLFILLGASLMDLPGKHALIRYIFSKPVVLQPINTLRAKWNRPPIQVPHDPHDPQP